jgi:tryptophan synthase beta chain
MSSDSGGYFGDFGGRYVPEALIPALEELEQAFTEAQVDPLFQAEFENLLKNFAGRPTPLTSAGGLTRMLGGATLYFKNEGLNITGAHKITHCLGQALLAKRLRKTRLIAETGAGQHGLATATIAAKLGFECVVYMGETDIRRQRPNVFLMEQLGATVVTVTQGSRVLKDAVGAAIRDWFANSEDTYYLLGSALGPHPYPSMVRYFQSVVGREIRLQIMDQAGRLPDYVVACVGGGSNAIGAFADFISEPSVALVGVEAGGLGTGKVGEHAARFPGGTPGVFEGYKSVFLHDGDGQLFTTHSISAGLDYPGVGPELASLKSQGRLQFTSATDSEALEAFSLTARYEGIAVALESAHALAHTIRLAPTLTPDKIVVTNVSGRGDKDIFILAHALGDTAFRDFLTMEAARYDE